MGTWLRASCGLFEQLTYSIGTNSHNLTNLIYLITLNSIMIWVES